MVHYHSKEKTLRSVMNRLMAVPRFLAMVHVKNLSVVKSDKFHYRLSNGINNRLYHRFLQLKTLRFS